MPATSESSRLRGRTPSERQWLRINDYLRGNRYRLAVEAAREYPDAAGWPGRRCFRPRPGGCLRRCR